MQATAPRTAFGWLIHVLSRHLTKCIMSGMLQPPFDPDKEDPQAPSQTPEHGKKGLNLDPQA